ncbi:MAG: nucleoside deaminase [Alphaproteobacteria bacterium]|nr:nucleoside deaminase [Alphaproteobacteria bacterium]
MTKDEYMQIALDLALQAAAEDEVPVGALIVNPATDEIIAKAYNQSAHSGDATAHAEILAIQRACRKLNTTRLWDMDMYVTLEPCTMCAAAVSFARIKNIYFGAEDTKGGAVVSGVKFYNAPTCHHKPHIEGGIMAKECAAVLKEFFKNKR